VTVAVIGTKPRLAFLGLGWIGRARMEAVAPLVEVAAVADPAVAGALGSLEELLALEPDGLVIATPSALHAEQAIAALRAGVPVFCQKPLGRDASETGAVVAVAERVDRLLGVDLSYRHTEAARRIKSLLAQGAIGEVYALELVFHNAYGPDKPWFRRRELAGGGCLVDLGTHLVDLALWLTESDTARVRSARVLREGKRLDKQGSEVEDYALAELELGGAIARLACSWWLPAGRDCVIELALYGRDGALALRNVGGSFYDFEAHLQRGTQSELLASPPDDWGGRALQAWATRLRTRRGFDNAAREYVALAKVIDDIYALAT
jgi:predicted dehydrogenase